MFSPASSVTGTVEEKPSSPLREKMISLGEEGGGRRGEEMKSTARSHLKTMKPGEGNGIHLFADLRGIETQGEECAAFENGRQMNPKRRSPMSL